MNGTTKPKAAKGVLPTPVQDDLTKAAILVEEEQKEEDGPERPHTSLSEAPPAVDEGENTEDI